MFKFVVVATVYIGNVSVQRRRQQSQSKRIYRYSIRSDQLMRGASHLYETGKASCKELRPHDDDVVQNSNAVGVFTRSHV